MPKSLSIKKALPWLERYLRLADYMGVAQLYLKENTQLKEPLKVEQIKARILGHWGTVPGLNLIYAALNYVICKNKAEFLLITGPGHGAPAILANLFLEGTLGEFYPDYERTAKGFEKLIHDFSWPHTPFPSHVTPTVPGSILEGGELGYSLSTAYGAALDNPNLIVAAVVGDGEAETGPIATAWHANKFLNPKTSGAVLPIVHINGYKISNPTLFGTMSDEELRALFTGYGYEPLIVNGPNLEEKTLEVMDKAYQKIRAIQKKARASKKSILKPKWPVILLRSPKGLNGLERFHGHAVEGSFHSHGIPVGHPNEDPAAFSAIKNWLESYRVEELLDAKGRPQADLLEFVPQGKWRMGMSSHVIVDLKKKPIRVPSAGSAAVRVTSRGEKNASSMKVGAEFLRKMMEENPKSFRMFCPDEMESNLLGGVFKTSPRAYLWPIPKNAESVSPDGRVIEMLSEHTLQGMMQGYLLTGRAGMFISYEAFVPIISSMVDQYAKFLKQCQKVAWRKPIPSAVYVLTSVGWRQDHNGYSHQNPSFVSSVLQKHGEFCQIYYPADANSLLVALEEVFKKKNSICVIVSDKRDLPQWLTLAEAREQAKVGMGIWSWVGGKEGTKNPDVVLASAGDHITQEALLAVKLCRELLPEMKIRYVNVSELTSLCLGDVSAQAEKRVNRFFTEDKPVVFNYHGYINDVEHILWPYVESDRFSIHGYEERGSTTTPFDLRVANRVSCYHVAIDLIRQASKKNRKLAGKSAKVIKELEKRIADHQDYITRFGDDPAEQKRLRWSE